MNVLSLNSSLKINSTIYLNLSQLYTISLFLYKFNNHILVVNNSSIKIKLPLKEK